MTHTLSIAIAGARGLVGSALARRFPRAVKLGHDDLDITDRGAVRQVIGRTRPDVIVNCAVIGVDECERDPALARVVNVDGPGNLAEAAQEQGAAIVHFSSNYVFDGEGRKTYAPEDEPRPVNVYGRTKLAGERLVAERCSRAIIVRTSWVYGPNKDSFLATVASRLAKGERVRAIADTWASCTYVEDLVDRLLELRDPGLSHIVNEGVLTYEDFAREAARLVGAPESLIEPVAETREAPRPRYTPLRCRPALRSWQEALRAYLQKC